MIKPSLKAAAKELQKRSLAKPKEIELDPNFPKQNALIDDPSRFISAQCSRRAGKTNGLAIKFLKTLNKYPGAQCLYLSLTRTSAFEILWPVLQEMNDRYNMGCTFIESRLTMKHPNGSKLILMGADMKDFIKRLKGRKYPGIAIDEAQDFGPHLESLVNDVLTPSMADYEDGWLVLTGTPGPVPKGYFFEITQQARFGYSRHSWTLLDNPYMPDPAKFINELVQKREWTDEHPTYRREYKNEWVLDTNSLWIRYAEGINNFATLPPLDPTKWHYILGIDLGFKDADALAVLAWHDQSPTVYLVDEVITSKQGITELVNQIEAITKKYQFEKMVIDEGGLGKKIAEELRRQKRIPVQQADKALKQQNVEFLNDALRLGKFKAKSASRFAQDSYLVQIDWEKSRPDKIVIRKHPHSDIIDAVLYAFKESPAWTYEPPAVKHKPGTLEWANEQERLMFEAMVDRQQNAFGNTSDDDDPYRF